MPKILEILRNIKTLFRNVYNQMGWNKKLNKFVEKFDGEHVMGVVGHTIIINNIPTP
jgi:hypothetical protein